MLKNAWEYAIEAKDRQIKQLQHELADKDRCIKQNMLQIEAYEKELSDADCLVAQLSNLAQTWCRRLGHKINIIRWPRVKICVSRVVARSEGKYTTPDNREYAGIFTGEPHE